MRVTTFRGLFEKIYAVPGKILPTDLGTSFDNPPGTLYNHTNIWPHRLAA